MSMRSVGNTLELRIWADGGTRPAASMYTTTIGDPDLLTGTAGLTTLPNPVVTLEAHLTDVV